MHSTKTLVRVSTLLLAALAAAAMPVAAQSASARPTAASPPPLIDRELIFGNPEITGAQISPDGQFISFIKPYKDTRNVWVKKAADPFTAGKLLTADTKRPIAGYFWSHDSKYVLFVQDQAGDENFNVYAVNPSDSAAAGQDAPPARNLTEAKGARAIIYDVPVKQPDVILVGLNDRDAAWHDLYRVKISTGERTLLRRNDAKIATWIFDNSGELRLAVRTDDATGDTEILRVDAEGFKKIYSCTVFESCGPVRFHQDGTRVYVTTNKGSSDLVGLVLLDVKSGAEQFVESDPLKRVDFGTVRFSDRTDEIQLTSYTDDRTRRYFKDKALEADYQLLTKKLPDREVSLGSTTADEQRWIVSASAETEPGETYLFDRRTKELSLQYRIREKLPREHLASMKPIRYKSSDGLEIPAYLTLPKGVAARNLPLVVVPHGGPWARDTWGYSGMPQFLANRGYAVLQPNFRGSTGYGKKFQNAGNNQWGDKMQDDLTWGVKHLVAEGIADPKRVGIMGGSYGGYATLAGVAFTPDVYAAGVSIVGPSNLMTLLDTIPPYWASARAFFQHTMGDSSTPEGRKQLERQSPLNSAAKIKTPLLVVQGANDPRVKQAESDQIVIALRDRGFPVEYIVAPDEGHGFARPVNNMSMFAAAEKFLSKHLEGRFQESMTPEVAARLKEITVDPKTVKLTKKVDTAAVGAPKPAVDLKAGSTSYDAKIAMGAQSMALAVTTSVREEGGAWVVTDTAKMAGGEAVDTVTLQKGTLTVLKRSVKQGPATIELAFDGGKATGTIDISGSAKPVAIDLGGPLFADGPAMALSIAALPLAEGYSTTLRNFDVRKQKVALKQVKVTATESVTVPAGTFKAFKVEISSAEGDPGTTNLWIATDSRAVLKISATMPEMGGATLTAELLKPAGSL
jgi:dipeptidyl aminopeptidase/acylaminoacyl peptidase